MIIPRLRNIFLLFILPGIFVNAADKSTNNIMLTSEDLKYFLNALDNLVLYTERTRPVLNTLEFKFGLFLLNVNLNTIMRNKANLARVPHDVNLQLSQISRRLERLMLISNTTTIAEFYPQKTRLISRLFMNTTRWSSQLPSLQLKYRTLAVVEDNPLQFAEMYRDYETYRNAVYYIELWDPTPQMSDECFVALSSYVYKMQKNRPKVCELPLKCENSLKTGTDFGYALSHRILLLAVARMGVGCVLLGKLQDEELSTELCQQAYYEGLFIAKHDYEWIDLMQEFVVACSLLGHTEFLRRDWLEQTVRFQTSAGCFYSPYYEQETNGSKAERLCNMHLSAVTVAALGFAVRWILENDYGQENNLYNDTKMLTLPFLRRLYETKSRHDQDNRLPARKYFFI